MSIDKSYKAKNQYNLTIDERILRMKLAFSNAKLPIIYKHLQTLGYTVQKLEAFLNDLQKLEELQQKQKMKYAQRMEKTAELNSKRSEINDLYTYQLGICRLFFREDVEASTALEFQGRRKQTYAGWYQQVSNFYKQLVDTPKFLVAVQQVNIHKTDLQQAQNALEEMSILKQSQRKASAEAQKATEERNQFLKRLWREYSDLVTYAKMLLTEEQHLEAMGIVIKRTN